MKNRSARHWVTMFACALLVGTSIGITANCLGVFIPPVAEDMNVSRGFLGFCTLIGMLLTGVAGFIVNTLLSRDRLKTCIYAGIALAVGSSVLTSFVSSPTLYLLLGVIRSLGCGMIGFPTTTIIINRWFREKNGFAVSVVMAFTGVIGAIFSPVLNSIVVSQGWRAGMRWMAFFLFLLTMIASFFIKSYPSEFGLLPYGASETDLIADRKKGPEKKVKINYLSFGIIALAVYSALVNAGTVFSAYAVDFAGTKGLLSSTGSLMVSACMVGNIISNVLVGWSADRIGGVKTTILFLVFSLIPIPVLCLMQTDAAAAWLAVMFFYGFIYGTSGVTISVLSREFFGREQYGSVYALTGFFMNGGGALASLLIGVAYDVSGSYVPALIGLAVCYIISGILVIALSLKVGKKSA